MSSVNYAPVYSCKPGWLVGEVGRNGSRRLSEQEVEAVCQELQNNRARISDLQRHCDNQRERLHLLEQKDKGHKSHIRALKRQLKNRIAKDDERLDEMDALVRQRDAWIREATNLVHSLDYDMQKANSMDQPELSMVTLSNLQALADLVEGRE